MTKQEFISKHRALQMGALKYYIITILFVCGSVVGIDLIGRYIKARTDLLYLRHLAPIACLVWIIFLPILVWLYDKKFKKHQSWRLCLHCHRMFNPQTAIATGNCEHCGEKVFNETGISKSV